jgi:hypothetical protein
MTSVERNHKKLAKVLLVVLLMSSGLNMITCFRLEDQLQSPLIPKFTVAHIARPYLLAALVSVAGTIVALISFFYSKYLPAIVTCVAILAWQIYYLNWGAFAGER